MGADLMAITADFRLLGSIIEDGKIDEFLRSQRADHNDIEQWTYVSHDLDNLIQRINMTSEWTTFLSDYNGHKLIPTSVFSVQDNYL